jgi:glycosyltransferase involved in cell wall biosynthesis
MGRCSRDEVADAYAGIDVLVVPSLWLENSPLVIHEAYLAGVPVVGSRIGGIADLVRDGWNGLLVEPGSPSGLAAALRQLVDRPGLLAHLAARLPTVKTIEDDAREWEGRYARVIAARTPGTTGPRGTADAARVARARLDGALTT